MLEHAGRCISAALSRKPGDVQECLLNAEAKPYISESLRQLFDSEPESFHASIPRFEMSTKTLARSATASLHGMKAKYVQSKYFDHCCLSQQA